MKPSNGTPKAPIKVEWMSRAARLLVPWTDRLMILDAWLWSDFLVCAQPNRILSNDTSWYIVEPWSSSWVQDTSVLHIQFNGWSVQTNTRRLRSWPEETVKCTFQPRYAVPHHVVLEATAETFSSRYCYADAIWFYWSYSSAGESFHL